MLLTNSPGEGGAKGELHACVCARLGGVVCVCVCDCALRDVEERVRGAGRQKEEGLFDVAFGPT